eukprot:m.39582 g.39582  ORF g.39582 m.39582 type:complete len:205 (-) comp11625_c0_seq1:343-957(-)
MWYLPLRLATFTGWSLVLLCSGLSCKKFEVRDQVMKRSRQEMKKHLAVVQTPPTSPRFGSFEPLPDPDDPDAPSSAQALELLQRLANDPNIIAIMQKHNWTVGVLKEFAPSLETGLVGVTDSCLLGYNQNHGEVIALRLRTDDFTGFRHYHVIIQTLLHELAHMVHGPHNTDFWNLFRQLRKEYESLHWTRSTEHRLAPQSGPQ